MAKPSVAASAASISHDGATYGPLAPEQLPQRYPKSRSNDILSSGATERHTLHAAKHLAHSRAGVGESLLLRLVDCVIGIALSFVS